ncbi:MAG: hypothetical protein WKG00_16570 [Polyangiaceae bacterium]
MGNPMASSAASWLRLPTVLSGRRAWAQGSCTPHSSSSAHSTVLPTTTAAAASTTSQRPASAPRAPRTASASAVSVAMTGMASAAS